MREGWQSECRSESAQLDVSGGHTVITLRTHTHASVYSTLS